MIFSPFERMVAVRYLRARRREGFISIIAWFSLLGIALGVATLIIVMAVMNGFRAELMGRILGLNGHIGVYATVAGMTDYDALVDKIRDIPGVTNVMPVAEQQVFVTSAVGGSSGALVRGVKPSDLRTKLGVVNGIREGSFDDFKGDDAVIIGDRLAQKLGVRVGDAITVISPTSTATAWSGSASIT